MLHGARSFFFEIARDRPLGLSSIEYLPHGYRLIDD
jgi:hypothetical protein